MATIDEIEEYKGQLADVEGLLKESPNDASLLSLKRDLMELLEVSGGTSALRTAEADEEDEEQAEQEDEAQQHGTPAHETTASLADNALDQALRNAVGSIGGEAALLSAAAAAVVPEPDVHNNKKPMAAAPAAAAAKKKKVKTEFEIPNHLEINESDTTAEKNKKKRAIKALKSKWKESVKEAESEQKQKSWQSFQKKRNVKGDSIFKTGDTAVGVVSAAGRKLTDFEDRKRHKHTKS
jgi:hypothetical protein